MIKDLVTPVIVALITGALAGGVVPLIQVFRGRSRARVDAVRELSATAHDWVERFEVQANKALNKAEAMEVELDRMKTEARALGAELYRIRTAIFEPHATIDGLRELVRRGPANGQPG
jgi:hypothetical protein